MAGEEGIEPSLTVLETAVLPLNHSPIFNAWVKAFTCLIIKA